MPEPDLPSADRRWPRWLPTVAVIASAAVALAVAIIAAVDDDKPEIPAAKVINEVDWQRAVIDLPKNPDMRCPVGKQHMRPIEKDGAVASFGWAPAGDLTDNLILNTREIAYGDLTGDGKPEAILNILCSDLPAIALHNDLRGGQLLVVTMRADHSLIGLGYAGKPYAQYPSFRVENQKLVAQVWYARDSSNGYSSAVYAPAHSRTYQWDGARLLQTAGRTSPLVLQSSRDLRVVGSPVQLATILRDGATVCPGRTVRFGEYGVETGGDGYRVTSEIRPTDLDHDGNQELLVEVQCTIDGAAHNSLYLFGQSEDKFVVLDVPVANGGQYFIQDGWQVKDNTLTITVTRRASDDTETHTLIWTGAKFDKTIGEYRTP